MPFSASGARSRLRLVSLLRMVLAIVVVVFITGSGISIIGIVVTSFRQNLIEKNTILAYSISSEVGDYVSGYSVSLSLLTNGFFLNDTALGLFGATFSDFEGITVLDRRGMVVAGIGEGTGTIGYDYSNRDFFTVPVRTGKTWISPSWMSERTYTPGVSIAIPFRDGVVVGRLSLEPLGDLVGKLSANTGDVIAIADSNGYFIAHTEAGRVARRETVTIYDLSVHDGVAGAIRGSRGFSSGREYFMSVAPVAGTGWIVVSIQSGEYLSRSMNMAALAMLASIVLASAASFIIVSLVLRSVERDIGLLVWHTGAVADGDYSHLSAESRFREFSELSANFSKMTEAVRKRETALIESGGEIRDNLAEKEVLLKEIHHRVKNNLQLVSSLLSLQAETVSDSEAVLAFGESMDRIGAMAMIHEMLYESDNLAVIDMSVYIKTLVDSICVSWSRRAENVRFSFDLDPVSLSVDDAIPCGLILNEMITNSLKYAFGEGVPEPLVSVGAKRDGETVSFRVQDNGCGIPPDFVPETVGTLGMRIIVSLCGQLRAKRELSGTGGTSWVFSFIPGSSAASRKSSLKSV